MRVTLGDSTYEWIDDWAKIPPTETSRKGWAHHGMAVSERGFVISFHQEDRTLLAFDAEGTLRGSHKTELTEGHGMTLVKEGDTEFLWMADNGSKRRSSLDYEYPPDAQKTSGRVVKMDLEGRILKELPKPDDPGYQRTRFSPTSVAVDEERLGGTGDVWVADGYGLSLVHRFDKGGRHRGRISGEEGKAGRFNTPHGVFIDRRKGKPELYIADRTNARVQVYDLEGRFIRSFGSDFLTSPSAFAVSGDLLIIAELRARLAVVDIGDRLVGYVGENEEVCDLDGWPNMKDSSGKTVRTDRLRSGKFNSPHGLAVDSNGNIYVAEWLIGGRHVKLLKT
jgi:hypothetical protein